MGSRWKLLAYQDLLCVNSEHRLSLSLCIVFQGESGEF